MDNQFSKFYKKELELIKQSIEEGKTLAIIGIYAIGKRLLLKLCLEKINHVSRVVINLKNLPKPSISEVYELFLDGLLKNGLIGKSIKKPLTDFEFHYLLKKVFSGNRKLKVVFFLHEAQNLLHLPDSFYDALESLRYYQRGQVSFIFLAQPAIFNSPTPGLVRLIKNNYHFLKIFDKATALADFKLEEKILKTRLSHKSSLILQLSRGLHGSIVYFAQILAREPDLNKKQLVQKANHDPLMNLFITEYINGNLTKGQLNLIREFVTYGKFISPIDQSSDFKTLEKLQLFTKYGNKIKFVLHAFNQFLRNNLITEPSNKLISYSGNNILVKGIICDLIFNHQERLILWGFLKSGNKMLSYQDIGNILWKDKEDEFSLWAIHKLISRLRKKLNSLGLPLDSISTISKQGYTLAV